MIGQKERRRDGQVLPTSQITILLLGWVSSRKTLAKNLILNTEERLTRRTKSSKMHSGEVAGVKVSVVDTPGWWKFFPAQYTPDWVKMELRRSVTLGSGAPHAVLLAVPADTTFLEEQKKITEDNMKMFGEQVWSHTMVLFTCGDLLGKTSIEEHIESEGEPLQWLVEKCGNRYHVFDGINKGNGSQVTELLEKIKTMAAPNKSFNMGQTLEQPEMGKKDLGMLLNDLWEERNTRMEANIELSSNTSKHFLVNFSAETYGSDSAAFGPLGLLFYLIIFHC
ncbi:hypothetical protein ACEWY4_017657 [Coilia grayii]|uniref:AIG1-type G domain-containing protein n=1 Tax=Coilia grayii TaxID=363190 RepID=A0ABD1JKX0_9TELE